MRFTQARTVKLGNQLLRAPLAETLVSDDLDKVQRDENGDVYEEWNFDSNLAMFRLKRLDPGYRERHEVTMSDAKLNEEIQRLLDKRG